MPDVQVQIDPPSGAVLLGGDQLHWSDLAGAEPSSATSYLLHRLSSGHRPRSVLLLGPRAAAHLDAVQASSVSVLVRGLPDARQLSALAGERDELLVFCGPFDRFPTERSYDLVVCLDDPTTVATPDSPGAGHTELLRLISTVLAPDGVAVTCLGNTLGLDDLLRLEVRSRFDDDSQWFRGSPDFVQRSPYHHEVAALLAAAGLTARHTYAAYACSHAPALLVGDEVAREAVDSPEVRRRLTALLQRVEAAQHSRTPALLDPYALSRKVIEAGMVSQVAPAWLVITGHADAAGGRHGHLPDVVLGDQVAAPGWAAVITFDRAGTGWSRRAVAAAGHDLLAERRLRRDLRRAAGGDGAPDAGESLQERLRVAATRGDLRALQGAVRGYADWLLDPAFADPAGRFFATPDNVLVHRDGTHSLLDPSWSWAEPLDARLAVVRGLRSFAHHLLRSGAEHHWRPDISPDDLARTLAAMADLPVEPALLEAVARRETEVSAVLQRLNPAQESRTYAANLAGGVSQFSSAAGPSRGYRESLALTGRMAQELHERGEQVRWLESSLRDRDRRVAALERELRSVRGSVSYRTGRRITAPGRGAGQAVVRAGRKGALSMLPPDFTPRAERALRRLLDR